MGRVDAVFAGLKNSKTVSDVANVLSQDPWLLVGLGIVVAILLLLLRIYIWPHINPFQFKWAQTARDDLAKAVTPADKGYPYARVLFPDRTP